MTGYNENKQSPGDSVFYVNDPFYDTTYYPAAEVAKGVYTGVFNLTISTIHISA